MTRLMALAAVAVTAFALAPIEPVVSSATPAALGRAGNDPRGRFLLIALDAADWHLIDPLIARGELPHLAELKARGAYGPLKTIRPTLSPVVWTSIATGVEPARHGIEDFFASRLEGVSGPLPRLRPPRRLGFGLLESVLRRRHVWSEGEIGTDARRVPAFWNIASAQGSPVILANWWVTWPAEPVLGSVVTDRFYFDRLIRKSGPPSTNALTYPEKLFDEVKDLMVLPGDLPIETARRYFDVTPEEYEGMRRRDDALGPLRREFNYFVASFETDRRVALHLLQRQPKAEPADALVLFRLVDKMSHGALVFSELVQDHLGASPADVHRFGRAVSVAYREADSAIGDLMEAFGPGNVIVVSDHGFELERHRVAKYNHDDAPDGVFLAAGPAFKPGAVDGLSIYDVLPLLLYLRGFPTAEDQRGHVPRAALAPDFLAANTELRIASYGTQAEGRVAQGDAAVDQEVLEQLAALGYVRYWKPRAGSPPEHVAGP